MEGVHEEGEAAIETQQKACQTPPQPQPQKATSQASPQEAQAPREAREEA
jgi:hypothetical protein